MRDPRVIQKDAAKRARYDKAFRARQLQVEAYLNRIERLLEAYRPQLTRENK